MTARPSAMLVVVQGIADMTTIPIEGSSVVIGRLPDVEVPVDNPHVSRRHAEVYHAEGQFHVRDLGSINGTFLNGSRVGADGRLLNDGDLIQIVPEHVELRFRLPGGTTTVAFASGGRAVDTRRLRVDARAREVEIDGSVLRPPLSRKEFDVLHLLYECWGEACSKDDIAARGWPERPEGDVGDQEIEQLMRRLRVRIESNPSRPRFILTLRGYGYKLVGG